MGSVQSPVYLHDMTAGGYQGSTLPKARGLVFFRGWCGGGRRDEDTAWPFQLRYARVRRFGMVCLTISYVRKPAGVNARSPTYVPQGRGPPPKPVLPSCTCIFFRGWNVQVWLLVAASRPLSRINFPHPIVHCCIPEGSGARIPLSPDYYRIIR